MQTPENRNPSELLSGFLDAFARALSKALTEAGPEEIEAGWNPAADPQHGTEDWTWWSSALNTPAGASLFFGAPEETWEKLGRSGSSENPRENASALLSCCFANAVEQQFSGKISVQNSGVAGPPPEDWCRTSIEIRYPAGQWPSAGCVVSPEFEEALAGAGSGASPAQVPSSYSARPDPGDLLMSVQVPVSVCFGATQIRMKDLLSLSSGSVVELNQALHDNVEVRVNDRVIARGEVVAVDGHYGVRVLELVSGQNSAKGIAP